MTSEAEAVAVVRAHPEAAFAYAMNMAPAPPDAWYAARDAARALGIPTVWHTIEDPNSHEAFLGQARHFDVIATTDSALIQAYARRYPTAQVIWVPLAADPQIHRPLPEASCPADCVLLANWYDNPARQRGVRVIVDSLLDAGLSLALYAYPTYKWPARYDRWWRGATHYLEAWRFYPEGRIALVINNQAERTTMCSMRLFEALACERPVLAHASSAYAALGFVNGEHFCWTDDPDRAVALARALLDSPKDAAAMAARGRAFVLARHTYRLRFASLLEAARRR